jgi:N-acetyl-anhydromuramyl-L-alanine amidase AmpD
MYDTSIQTDKYFQGKTNSCRYVMLHHTASEEESLVQAKYLAKWPKEVSCHYVVWWGGEARKLADDTRCTWHAWKWERDGIIDQMNLHAIGIEVCGIDSFSKSQQIAVRKLIQELVTNHNIPYQNIIRHKDYAPWRKIDIDDNFWNKEYKTRAYYQKQFANNDDLLLQRLIDDWYWNGEEWDGLTRRVALLIAKTKYT